MIKKILFILFFHILTLAQENSVTIDSLYREDQFYAGITYVLSQNKPSGYSQYGFSMGLNTGFLRDMPINKRRNIAVALGVGFSYLSINHNLSSIKVNNVTLNEVINPIQRGFLETIHLDFPIEFRWRTSTPSTFAFYRVYFGLRNSFKIYDKTRIESTNLNVSNYDTDVPKFLLTPYFAFGNSNINFIVSYTLQPLINGDIKATGEKIKLNQLGLGLQFYIL